MADPIMMFCHVCRHEFERVEYGLECPECHSDFVEEIEPDHDPRNPDSPESEDRSEIAGSVSQFFALPDRRSWNSDDPPDPEEGDIEHVEWNAGPNLTFSRTSYRSSTPGFRSATARLSPAGYRGDDSSRSFFPNFSPIRQGVERQGGLPNRQNRSSRHSSRTPDRERPNPFPQDYNLAWGSREYNAGPNNPREGIPGQGSPGQGLPGSRYPGRSTFTARTRVWPQEPGGGQLPQPSDTNLQGLLGSLLQSLNNMNQAQNLNGTNPAIMPIHLLARLLDPANAAHGDAVYTEEALDRVITQFMEQAQGSGAPGPASPEAIAKLPKKAADKSMMGSDGKAECSVCMDNVDIGDEVTVLPCSHWFHGECVGAWLKEHDTCPHCRQGIMPKDANGSPAPSPRLPDQPPWNNGSTLNNNSGMDNGREFNITYSLPRHSSFHRTSEQMSRPEMLRRRSGGRELRNGGEGSSAGLGSNTNPRSAGGAGGAGGVGGVGGGGGGGGRGLGRWVRDLLPGSDRNT